MKNLFLIKIFVIFVIIFFILLTEHDRNKRPKIDIKKYYNLKQIILGIFNSLVSIIDNKYIFNEKKLNIHKKFILNHNKIFYEITNAYNKYKLLNPGIFDVNFKQNDNNYGYFFIKYSGYNITNNVFPTIENIIREKEIDNEEIETCFISIINGKKNIPEHRGPYKGVLRYHYTVLSDNSKKNFLQVLNKKLYWKEKTGFLFDDTYYHKAKKETDGLRIVIICDIKRKLPFILSKFNNLCLEVLKKSRYVNYVKKKLNLKHKYY